MQFKELKKLMIESEWIYDNKNNIKYCVDCFTQGPIDSLCLHRDGCAIKQAFQIVDEYNPDEDVPEDMAKFFELIQKGTQKLNRAVNEQELKLKPIAREYELDKKKVVN